MRDVNQALTSQRYVWYACIFSCAHIIHVESSFPPLLFSPLFSPFPFPPFLPSFLFSSTSMKKKPSEHFTGRP